MIRSAAELAEHITERRGQLCARWAELVEQEIRPPDWAISADVFAAYLPAFLAAVAASLRGDHAWQGSGSEAMTAAQRVGHALAATGDGQLLLGYHQLLEVLESLPANPGGEDVAVAQSAAAVSRILAPARSAVWVLAAASAEAMLDGAPAGDERECAATTTPGPQAAGSGPTSPTTPGAAGSDMMSPDTLEADGAAPARAGSETSRSVRHDLRNCLNNMNLTVALMARRGAGLSDEQSLAGIKEEITAMSRILDALDGEAKRRR